MKKNRFVTFLIISVVLLLSMTSVIAEGQIIVDFYWSEACGDCVNVKMPIFNDVIDHYRQNTSVIFQKKEVSANETNKKEMEALSVIYPAVIIHNKNNKTEILGDYITRDYLIDVFDTYIAKSIVPSKDRNIINTPFGEVNLSSLSLPVFTIVLGGLDSFYPCAFFILLILLSLLVTIGSRWKILLVGRIFIIFSGLFYLLFMLAILSIFTFVQMIIISLIAGTITAMGSNKGTQRVPFLKPDSGSVCGPAASRSGGLGQRVRTVAGADGRIPRACISRQSELAGGKHRPEPPDRSAIVTATPRGRIGTWRARRYSTGSAQSRSRTPPPAAAAG